MRSIQRLLLAAMFCVAALPLAAQTTGAGQRPAGDDMFPPLPKSRTEKFFIGGGLEGLGVRLRHGDDLSPEQTDWGFAVTVGYGLTPRWSIYSSSNGGSVPHIDVGARAYFFTNRRRIRPFVEAAVAFPKMQFVIYDPAPHVSEWVTAPGGSVGGGVNIHSSPAMAVTLSAVFTRASFSEFGIPEFDNRFAVQATTTRIGFGVTWFPKSSSR